MDWLPSDLYDQTFVISQQVAAPEFNPVGGVFNYAPVPVNITCATADATIWYSIDGGAWNQYTEALQITGNSTLVRAKATKTTWVDSPVVTMNYIIIIPKTDVVTFDPPQGTYNTPQSVTLSTTTAGAQILYTLGAGEPDQIYDGNPIIINETSTILAKATFPGYTDSDIVSATYTISPLTVLSPVLTPEAGVYYQPVTVRMYERTGGSTIWYRLGEGAPALQYDPLNPPVIANTTLVKAFATKAEMIDSEEVGALYTITGSVQLPVEVFAPAPGIYTSAVQVTLNTAAIPADASLYYTIDGSNPVNFVSPTNFLYTAPFMISPVDSPNVTVRVRGFKDQWLPSDTATAVYTFQAATPVFDPASGTFTAPVSVSIDSSTPGASIRYTTDGSNPSPTVGTQYIGAINVPGDSSYFINAIVYLDNWLPSPIASASYNVTGTVANVTFNPPSGIYQTVQNVVLATTTNGATIYYTTDGSEPDESSSVYAIPVFIPLNSTNYTIKARAYRTGWTPSAVTTAVYTITGQVVMGSIIPAPCTVANAVTVSIGNPSPTDAPVFYTTDGSEPTQDSTPYAGQFILDALDNPVRVVKAKAFKTDWLPSETITNSYTYQAEAPFFNPSSGSYASPQEIVLTSGTAGAAIYYTTDGSEPTMASNLYSGIITVSENSTIRARAFNDPYLPSPIVSATYGIG
ncbi:MAG TPA: chitobiase/beta-hexosaminidase C-terminal domain-containing protein, partial [Candidatus Cloacimonadota bacterium]|nr:chitobiase/beta-hexosaminidase C-terminal domain-containing protein [Candidatus Cloacimonadota bacterium]